MAKIPGKHKQEGYIGATASALLTESQFQTAYGAGWVLMDGRSVVGSKYATLTGNTTIPDARGMVLRGKNSGGSSAGTRADGNQNPDGDTALGTFQNDAFQGHFHTLRFDLKDAFAAGSSGNWPSNLQTDAASAPTSDNTTSSSMVREALTDGTNGTPRNSTETRMRNITVNHFIKIN